MITLYTKPNCPFCVKAKDYLDEHEIEYQTVDITENSEAYKFVKERHDTVPQIYYGGQILVEGGYTGLSKINPDVLKQLIH